MTRAGGYDRITSTIEENKRTARRLLEELFEKGNLDATDEADPRLALRGRRVIEHWSVRDDLGQALQLGLMGEARA
jgi:hypothetical protein